MSGKSFLRSTVIVLAVTLIGRMLGFLRNMVLTNWFGVNRMTDAYNAAFIIPSSLFLIVPGAINSVLIPTLKGVADAEHAQRRNELVHKTMTFVTLLFFAAAAAGMIWVRPLADVLAAKGAESLTAELLRIMMPSAVFIGIIAVQSSVLNAHNEFFAPTFGAVINGAIVIASFYILAPFMGMRGVAWGTTAGYVIFALYLMFPMKKENYTLRWNVSIAKDRELRAMGERFVPIMIGMIVSQLYLVLERIMGAMLGSGKVTTLALANSLFQLPIAIFSGALVVPLFPLLAEYVKKNQMKQMKDLMAKGFLYQYHVLLPTTAGMILLAKPIVRLFYDHSNHFTGHAVDLTAFALIFYSVGMIGWAGRDLLTRASYAIENTKRPVIAGAVSLIVYVALGLLLMPVLDHGGLALAYALATYFNMIVQGWFLRKEIGRLFEPAFYVSLLKGAAAVLVMSAVVWLLRSPTNGIGILQLPVLAAAAAVIYFGILMLLKEDTVKDLLEKVTKRVAPSKS